MAPIIFVCHFLEGLSKGSSEQAADQWLSKDPAVAAKVLNASVRQWGVSNIRGFRGE
jgi:hypothetical protein